MYRDFLELVKKFRGHHDLNLDVFTDDDINAEVHRFGKLPPSYVNFLKSCPTGSYFDGSFILYEGLLSFDDLSLEIRTASEKGLIAFGDDMGGTLLCFDTENPDEYGEYPVVEYVYPHHRTEVAKNFQDWLMSLVGLYV
jgi:hypothetical protein